MRKYRRFYDYKEYIKENLKELKVIYTDLDGTFLNDKGCLVKDWHGDYYLGVIKQLEKISKKNWDIVLVSGRNKVQLKYNAQFIGVKNYIAELGSELVYDLGKKVFVTFDNKKYHYDLTYKSKDLLDIIKLFKEKFPGKIDSNMKWSINRSYNALFFGEIDLDLANKILEDNGYSGLILVDNGFSSLVDLDINVKKLHIYNLLPYGVNKSNGVKLDKKIRNLKRKNCIALGDSVEDLKIAKEVQFFFLMRDAIEHNRDILNILSELDNVYATEGYMNRGWVEVMEFLAD